MRLGLLHRGMGRDSEQAVRLARELVAQANHIVAFTGAGISTPSGIPDFRSPESGLWAFSDPMEVASIWGFRRQPEAFFEWVRPLAETIQTARPNSAHKALAQMEKMGKLRAVITQNIDELHQRAGSRRVLELHGHLREATCMRCFNIVPGQDLLKRFINEGVLPRCSCGGILKPNVILFGEMLPQDIVAEAKAEARSCDLMIIAGSSMEVAPASDLPVLARETGARLIIVNYQATALDREADVIIREDVAKVLPALLK